MILILCLLIFFSVALPKDRYIGELCDLAEQRNYDIKASEFEVLKSEGSYIQSKAFQNPTFSINYTGLDFSKGYPTDTSNSQVTVRVDQPIELGGKREYRIKGAYHQLLSTKLQALSVKRLVCLDLTQVYFQTLSDRDFYNYLRQDLEDFTKILEVQREKYNRGFISYLDYLKLNLYKLDLENAIAKAEASYKKDLKQLSYMLGGLNYEPKAEEVEIELKPLNLERLTASAMEKREDVKAIKEQIKSADYNIKLLKAYSVPDISLGVEYDSFGVRHTHAMGFGFALNIPVLDRKEGDLLTAIASKEQSMVNLKKLELYIRTQIEQAYEDYMSSLNTYKAYLRYKEQMDALLDKTKKSYIIGGISVLDFLDTLRTYRAFMNSFLQAKYNYLNSLHTLLLLSGEEP
ncbi:TolC family protein [Thermocrinis minervae]|uniref:Outer membrane protein, cobalt-zinc-cadmium efflux system n=1 Tax=Thermocrinis minervae TaxID=381751 RepID=A0A1M6RN35_9AQUI|nr:TolC family protein [Thermocrinis minervae]SHK33931.1 outer membrane protein, cobalt-zinc-cadmium efflux system [Thermocrinis minervae]